MKAAELYVHCIPGGKGWFCISERFLVVFAINPAFSPLELVISSYAMCQKWMDTSWLVCLPSSTSSVQSSPYSQISSDRQIAHSLSCPTWISFAPPCSLLRWPARRLRFCETCFSGDCCRIVLAFPRWAQFSWELGWVMMLKLRSLGSPLLPLLSNKPANWPSGTSIDCRCGKIKRQRQHTPVVCCMICLVEFLSWKQHKHPIWKPIDADCYLYGQKWGGEKRALLRHPQAR